MVLDDSSSSSTSLDPSKNTDTWDSPDLESRYASVFPLKINREHLQRPNPLMLWVGFAGPWNWERTVMFRLSQQVETAKGLLRRDLTQPELDAITEHASREMNTRRIGLPVGVTAGAVHAYYTFRKKLSMPNNVSLFESFRTAWRLAPVVERRSAALQAGMRFGAWALFMIGNFGGVATYRLTVALKSDPRLGEFREAIKRYAEARMQRMEGFKEKARQRREGIDAVRHAGATGSAEEYNKEAEGESVGAYGQAEEQGQSDAPPYQTYQTPSRSYEAPRSYTADNSSGSSDFFDDASPTAAEYQTPATTSKPSPPSNENAWDRIRRERASQASGSAPSTQPSWGRPQQPTNSEYSSFESEQQSGQRERDVAQRDFDRMLDAERQLSQQEGGGDENSSNKKGWRRW